MRLKNLQNVLPPVIQLLWYLPPVFPKPAKVTLINITIFNASSEIQVRKNTLNKFVFFFFWNLNCKQLNLISWEKNLFKTFFIELINEVTRHHCSLDAILVDLIFISGVRKLIIFTAHDFLLFYAIVIVIIWHVH